MKTLAVPKFTGGGSHCTARMCLSNHLICFGTLQSSNCVINTLLAQLEGLSSREAHHCLTAEHQIPDKAERIPRPSEPAQRECNDFRCFSKQEH